MKRCVASALVALGMLAQVSAGDLSMNVLAAYYIPNLAGYQSSGFAPVTYSPVEAGSGERTLGSTWGGAEAKVAFSYTDSIPVMVGEGLMAGNNLRGKATLELSPVSINGVGQVSLTPIAFLVFDAGAALGTGWTAGPFQGLGINPADNTKDINLTPFGGLVYRFWGAGTFQFDLAALMSGEWNHVVIAATAKVEYKAYTGAKDREAWLYEADGGENFNGAKFFGTYILGYQMPLMVNFVGLMAESEEWIGAVRDYSPMAASGGWGSDFRFWQVGSLTNLQLGEKDSLLILVQFKQARDYTDATTKNRSFETRDYEDPYWYFNRIALSYTHKF